MFYLKMFIHFENLVNLDFCFTFGIKKKNKNKKLFSYIILKFIGIMPFIENK